MILQFWPVSCSYVNCDIIFSGITLSAFLEKCCIICACTNTVAHSCNLVSMMKLWDIYAFAMTSCVSAPVSFSMTVPPSACNNQELLNGFSEI